MPLAVRNDDGLETEYHLQSAAHGREISVALTRSRRRVQARA